MSPALLERPVARAATAVAHPAVASKGGEAAGGTLAALLDCLWAELSAQRAVACPICGGAMAPCRAADAVATSGGRCADCGSVLGSLGDS